MNRRSALRRLSSVLLAGAAASVPSLPRAMPAALSTVRDGGGWLAVIGQHGNVVIRISPRFALEHPGETVSLLATGRLR